MKVDLNREFEERYLLVLSDEEKLYESIVGLTKEFTEGKIPSDLYVKSLDIANATVQEIHSKRSVMDRLIKQIRYHLFKMKEYIEINYEDGVDFIIVPNQTYVKLHNEFLARSHYFIKEWNQFEKEHGFCLPEMKSEIRSFELVFKMINLITDEYDAHVYPDQKLLHIYTLARQVPSLLLNARDLALEMNPQIIADQYFMKKYLNKPFPYTSRNYRMNVSSDFEYVREPGMPIDGKFQSDQLNTSKYFKSRLFESGLGLRTYQPTERPILKTNEHVDWLSDTEGMENTFKEDTTEENIPEEFPARQSVMPPSIASGTITPPGPKLYRDDITRKS